MDFKHGKVCTNLHRGAKGDTEKSAPAGVKNVIIYAINKVTREVADYTVGRRNKGNLKKVIDTLLFSKARKIYTDKLNIYAGLIPAALHRAVAHNINHIERNNLNLRTHIKRLSRKTLCFSKSLIMLNACVKIYFWG